MIKDLIYTFIYHKEVNKILRSINKFMDPVLPNWMRIHPSGMIRVSDHLDRTVKILTNQTNYITYLIFWGGVSNFEYAKIFSNLIKNVDSFVDVGANIGLYSLIAGANNSKCRVFSFEPSRGPLHYLRKNISLNRFSNIEVVPTALSNTNGKIEFYEQTNRKYKYLKYNLAGESNAGTKTDKEKFIKFSVESRTLDSYLSNVKNIQIDLIKLDTEGTEFEILEGAVNTIDSMKPIVICETLYNVIERDLEAFFLPRNYVFYNVHPNGLVKVRSIIRHVDDGIRNVFCVPPEKSHLIEEYVLSSD